MIRGVNKQIIEVNETENEYFEKAILFVRASKSDISTGRLHQQATKILSGMGMTPISKKKIKIQNLIRIICAAIGGSAITAILITSLNWNITIYLYKQKNSC